MRIYKDHIWIYLINVSLGFLVALSTQFKWALNVFNFSTIVLLLLTLLIWVAPPSWKNQKDKSPKLPIRGTIFIYSLRIGLMLFCAALGMFWQAVAWFVITITLYTEAKREERERES